MQDLFLQRLSNIIDEFESGHYEHGLEGLNQMLIHTTDPYQKLEIAKVYLYLGLIEDAKEITALIGNQLDTVEMNRFMAEISYKEGNYDDAIDLMHDVIQMEPNGDHYFFLSQVYFDSGLPEVAYRYISKAIDEDDQIAFYFYQKGLYAFEMGETENAIDHFQQAVDLEGKEPLYHLALGEAYYNMGQFEEALEEYDLVLNEYPGQEEALYLKGAVLIHMNQLKEGIQYLKKVSDMNPENVQLLFSLAEAFDRDHDQENSINILKQIIKIDEFHLPALKKLSELYLYQEDWVRASPYLTKAYEIDKEDESVQMMLNQLNEMR